MSLRDIAHSLFEEAITLQRPSNIVLKSSEKYNEDFSKADRIFPIAIGKIPSAMGSKVPAWPILLIKNFFLIEFMALKDVILLGLYKFIQPCFEIIT